jgi:hypothetical protein
MRVYVLHLANSSLLTRAFDRILGASEVASCMVEPERQRVRFLAPERCGDRLVERIYLEGGMRWCSRHPMKAGLAHVLGAGTDAA